MAADTATVKICGFWCLLSRPAPSTAAPPLLVFLHGAGERGAPNGRDVSKVKKHGPWRAPGLSRFLVIAPQCPTERTWPGIADRIVILVREVQRRFATSSCCIAGVSMGAFGCWAAAKQAPSMFDCVVAVCGGYSPPMPRTTPLKEVVPQGKAKVKRREVAPLRWVRAWLFHGTADARVAPQGSRELFQALGGTRRSERTLRLTEFEGMGHACWGRAFKTPGLLEWVSPEASPPMKRRRCASWLR